MTEDLGVVIEDKSVAAWIRIRDNATKELEENERAIIIGKEIISLAERKIAELKQNI